MDRQELKSQILCSLQQQGFQIEDERIVPVASQEKDIVRRLHSVSVAHNILKARRGLVRYESELLKRIADGTDVAPDMLKPRLIEVQPDSHDELLFRYARLHWSIPVSAGYGRRLRFLVVDEHNEKLIGIIGFGDPVFNLGARDKWIGWDRETRAKRLLNVADAFVLGAVPPYSRLLCGKLIALLVSSNEVREAFESKYAQKRSLISGKRMDGGLALISTTSALGRSSIYNRIKYQGIQVLNSVGFTAGSGDFHFSNGLYGAISEFVMENCKPTAKHERWGSGFRNRREVVRKCLVELGLSQDWLYHGVRREVFAIPLAVNALEFLRGEHQHLAAYDRPASSLFTHFRERWLLPRAARDARFREFSSTSYRLWAEKDLT